MSDFSDLFQQAKKMQSSIQGAQEALSHLEVVGEAGAGMVRIAMSGRHVVKRCELSQAAQSESTEVLQDLIVAAVNDAITKVESESRSKMQSVMADLGLPKDFDPTDDA